MNPAIFFILMEAARRQAEYDAKKYRIWFEETYPKVLIGIVEEGPRIDVRRLVRKFWEDTQKTVNINDVVDGLHNFEVYIYPDENRAAYVVRNFEDIRKKVLEM